MGLLTRIRTYVSAAPHSALGLTWQLKQLRYRQTLMLLRWFSCTLLAASQISFAGPKNSEYASSTLTRWLLRAELALAGNQLVSPPKDNALVHLERVLAEDPNNLRAAKLLDQLIVRFTMNDGAADAPRSWARLKVLYYASSAANGNGAGVTGAPQESGLIRLGRATAKRPAAQMQHAERTDQKLQALPQTVSKRMHRRLVELKNCRVSLGLAALQLGDTSKAGRQQKAAADLVSRHRLDDRGLSYLSRLIRRGQTPPLSEAPRDADDSTEVSDGKETSDWYYRVVGTV